MKRPKQYQTGGVFDLNPIVPQVGGISPTPIVRQPAITPTSLPDVLSLARDADSRRAREESRILREQQALGADQDQLFALRDKLFGEIHNPQQQKVIDEVKAEYGIKDNIDWDLNNPNHLKAQIRAYQAAVTDPRTKKVMGQVEGAKKLFEIASRPGSMTEDEILEYTERKKQYEQHSGPDPFPNELLFPSAVNKPKANSQPKFATATQKVVEDNIGLDPDKPEDRGMFFHNVAMSWHQTDAKGAEDLGYISIDPTTNFPVLTPLGQQTALNQHSALNSTFNFKKAERIDEYQTKKQIAETFEEPDSGGGKTKAEIEKEKATSSAWNTWVKLHPEFSSLDPEDEDVRNIFAAAVAKGGLTSSESIREAVADDLATFLPEEENLTPQERLEKANREANEVLESARRQGFITEPTSVAPVSPRSSSTRKLKYNPKTGTVE